MSKERPERQGQVVLVDCYATDRVFIRDASFDALAAALRERIPDTALIEVVRDDAPDGKSFDDACRLLRELRPATVVVSRAWDERVPRLLGAAAGPDATVVRFSHGAPSPIDQHFDQVLGSEGILDLLGGAEAIAEPSWRRTKRDLATPPSMTAPRPGERPAISGPARGCPFLADVRQSPAYRDSDIDFDSVQTKGCSFCLDNVGAYAAYPEAVVVDTWISQLRSAREAQPEVREILLTDERPHPYLPELFRRICADPALHGIELLIKTRVDWLEEYADSALREACDLAEQSGSVLHVYLVGFESFHQADLDLFNKAVSVTDNVRAIDTLRRLENRHPRSFEYRSHRAHGIVLFHPWTTPESLLDNARVMREVRFEELRSQALRTRLRLYASVPLHALAESQGLVVDSFSSGRTDRATEQGYDASIPWRFADPRIEAIFQGCNRLADELPEMPDADILELVTRFVLRWPTFADAPELTAAPIRQALLSWGTSPADVWTVAGAVIAGSDREVEAVARSEKPAALKEGVDADQAAALADAYRRMGLEAEIVSSHRRGGDDGTHTRGDTHAIVAVAGSRDVLEQVLADQRAVESGAQGAIAKMGEWMGYPPCCVAAFAAERRHGDNLDLERLPFRAHPERPLSAVVNRFGAVSLTPHFLCAPDCANAIELAELRLAALADLDGEAAERIRAHLASPALRLDYRRGAILQGAWDGDEYLVQGLHPMQLDELPASTVQRLRFSSDGATFVARNGSQTHVRGLPMLVEPGSPLAPPIRALLSARAPAETEREDRGPSQPQADLDGIAATLDQARVDDAAVAAIRRDGDALEVDLTSSGANVTVRIGRWQPGQAALSRRGPWAFDLGDDREPSDGERKLIGALARMLPSGSHARGGNGESRSAGGSKPAQARTRAPQRPGVVCTAPWTTLEVVDPDGLVRQCCADWTAGARGNLHESSLASVWNGEGYRFARRIMAGNELSPLCHQICPRLYDGKFAERELDVIPGAEPFVANQQLLLAEVAERREVIRAQPLYVAVCPSTYCNYDCIMCTHGRTPRRDLSESIWDELVAMLPTLRVLTLLGGEPLANPAAMQFLRNWDREQYPDASVAIITNGSLLGPRVLQQLERCNFGNVTISLNAGTAETYERVQRGIDLETVLANLDALIDLRRRQSATFPIVLSCVVQPANHDTLIQFGELARQRSLPIRLMPLSTEGVEELDFYDDPDQVARVLRSLDAMHDWAESAATDFLREIHGTRSAIAQRARGERPTDSPRA